MSFYFLIQCLNGVIAFLRETFRIAIKDIHFYDYIENFTVFFFLNSHNVIITGFQCSVIMASLPRIRRNCIRTLKMAKSIEVNIIYRLGYETETSSMAAR